MRLPGPMRLRRRPRLVVAAALAALAALTACSSPTGSPLRSASPTPATRESTASLAPSVSSELTFAIQTYPVPAGSGPHDVAPAADGGVWYTAQASGRLGWLDPESGEVREVALGPGSVPHGVIVGPDDAPWITDGGRNAILRVDPDSLEVTEFPLPSSASGAQPEHRRLRRGRNPVVHGSGRLVRKP